MGNITIQLELVDVLNYEDNEIKILDISYGIGYNTEAALNFLSNDRNIII